MRLTQDDKIHLRAAVVEYAKLNAEHPADVAWTRDFLSRLPVPPAPPQPTHWWRDGTVACGEATAGSVNSSPYRATCVGCKKAISKEVRATMREFLALQEGS